MSVELSVRRKSFSPARKVVAGIVSSPPTTPCLSAVNAPAYVGVEDPTAEMFPFDFAAPTP